MAVPTVADIVARASSAAFGNKLVTNVLRGLIVEAIVAAALEPEWTWCGADYASYDFQRADGLRAEVKQSAARQSWLLEGARPSATTFDIAARSGRWDNARWVAEPGRAADLYIFARHDGMTADADHRDPLQWRFFVVPSLALPPTKQIAVSRVQALADPCDFAALACNVARAAMGLKRQTDTLT